VTEDKLVELPEKVKEWKARRDHFDAILKDLLKTKTEGRENIENSAQ